MNRSHKILIVGHSDMVNSCSIQDNVDKVTKRGDVVEVIETMIIKNYQHISEYSDGIYLSGRDRRRARREKERKQNKKK